MKNKDGIEITQYKLKTVSGETGNWVNEEDIVDSFELILYCNEKMQS